ncbi:MAG: hypothetical protein ABIK53_08995 [bacterium]
MLDIVKRKTFISIPLVIILQLFVFSMICVQSDIRPSYRFKFYGEGKKEIFAIKDVLSNKTIFRTSFVIPKNNEYKVEIILPAPAKDNYTVSSNAKEMGKLKKGDETLIFSLVPKDVISNKNYIEFLPENLLSQDLYKDCPLKIKYIKFKTVLGYSRGLLNMRISYDTGKGILLKRLLISILFIGLIILMGNVSKTLIKKERTKFPLQILKSYLKNSFFTGYTLFGLLIVSFNIVTSYYITFSILSYIMLFVLITFLPMRKDIWHYTRNFITKYKIAVYLYWICSASFLASFILMPIFIMCDKEPFADKLGNVAYTLLAVILIIKIIRARRQDADKT